MGRMVMLSLVRSLLSFRWRRSATRTALIMLALCAVWVGLNARNLRQLAGAAQRHQEEGRRLQRARRTLADLRERHDLLKTSDFERERRVRQLRFLRPDERVIYIETEPEPEATP